MFKKELINQIANRHRQISLRHTQLAVNMILEHLMDTLSKGSRVEIRGFGAFYLKYRPARVVRNPKNGKTKYAPARHQLLFKTGKELKTKLNPNEDSF